jgi:hypothetical protein
MARLITVGIACRPSFGIALEQAANGKRLYVDGRFEWANPLGLDKNSITNGVDTPTNRALGGLIGW